MVLKEIIFHSLYLFWEGVVVLKEMMFNILYFERCEGHERMIFNSF